MIADVKVLKNRRRFLKYCIVVVVFLLVLQFFISHTYKTHDSLVAQNIEVFKSIASDSDDDKPVVFNKAVDVGEKISWEDKKFVAYEERRR